MIPLLRATSPQFGPLEEHQPKLILLSIWLVDTYGVNGPTIQTARRWARQGLIFPLPIKHGRDYFVSPNAAYSTNH